MRGAMFGVALGVWIGACGPVDDDADDDDAVLPCEDLASTAQDPVVTVVLPSNPHDAGDDPTVNWSVAVLDADTDPGDLVLSMEDTIDVTPVDVEIELPGLDAAGEASFVMQTSVLGAGSHPLRLIATDPQGCTGTEQVVVCVETASCP